LSERRDTLPPDGLTPDPRDAEIERLKAELAQARRVTEAARSETREARRAFPELAARGREFARSTREHEADHRLVRRRLGAQYEVARLLARSGSLEEASPRLLGLLGEHLGWREVSRWEVRGDCLRLADAWHRSSDGGPSDGGVGGARLGRGEGLAERAWRAGEPLWQGDGVSGSGALAVPLRSARGSFGVLECRVDGGEGGTSVEDLMATVSLVGEQVGQAVERWRAEEERDRLLGRERRSRAELSGILESISDAFFALDAERRFTYVNREAERLWGRDRGELLGRNIWEVFPGTVGSEPHGAVERALRDGISGGFESFSTALGLWMSGRVYPRAGGGVSVYFRDVTERKRVEEALRESEARFRRVFSNNMVPMAVWTKRGDIIDANDALLGLLGYTRAELEAREVRWDEITPLEYHGRDREAIAELEAHGFCTPYEKSFRHKDGRPIPIIIGGGSFDDRAGTGVFFAVDLTGRKRAEEALRESEERQDFLLRLSDALRPLADPAEIQGEAARILGQHLGVGRCGYGETDETGEFFTVEHDWTNGEMESLAGTIRLDDFGRDVIREYEAGRTVRVEDPLDDPRTRGAEWAYAEVGELRGGIGVPLIKNGRFVAAFYVHQTEPRRWTDAEVALVEDTAERIWAAVERARAEAALRGSEERLQKAVSIETVGVLFFDLDGRITGANEAFARMTGYGRDELLGSVDWEALTAPEFQERTARAAEELARRGETAPYEKQFVRKDGSRWWGLCAPTWLGGSSGDSECVEFVVDVTERREVEEALRESEEWLRLAQRAAGSGTWAWDLETGEIRWSEEHRELFGSDPEGKVTREDWWDAVHPDDVPLLEEAWRRCEAGEEWTEVEYRVLPRSNAPEGASGKVRWLNTRGRMFRDGSGKPVRVQGISVDITRRKEAEERLRESEERFRALVYKSADVITVSDRDGVITYTSPSVERVSGYTPEEFVGRNPFEEGDIHPDDLEVCARAFEQLAERPGHSVTLQHRYRHKSGEWRWLESSFTSLYHDPAVGGLVANFRDVTARKRAEERVRESEERHRTLFEMMDEGFCVIEMIFDESGEPHDYRFEQVNPAFERHTGLRGATGKTIREMVPDHEPHWFETYGRVALTGEPVRFVDHAAAMGRWFDVYAFRPDGAGSRRVAILFNDISERKRAEEALRESEGRFRTLVSNFPGAVYRCEWREEPTMVFVSDRIEEITGYPKDDLLENRVRSFGSLVHPKDRPGLDEQVMGALARREPYFLEYRILHADGSVRWINERGVGVFSEAGELLYLDGAMFDVTVREEARQALRESEERLHAVVDNAPIVLVAFDRDGVYRLAEGRGHESLGAQPGQAVGMSAWEVFRDNPGVLEDTRRALAGEAFTSMREVRGALWETSYTPLRDAAGRLTGAIAVGTDVTDRRRAEEARERLKVQEWVARAEKAERERISRELHDRVAHQMGVVHQSLELYGALKEAAPERAEGRLAVAREMARSSLETTRNLSAELRRSEAEDGIERALHDLLDALERPDFRPELSVRGDETRLPPHVRGQVFLILREAVRNAARHSGGEGVSVEVEVTPEEVWGRVADDGMGFEGNTTREGGIGLRSMKERAALLGGTLRVDSEEGSGTQVEVRVPLSGGRDVGR